MAETALKLPLHDIIEWDVPNWSQLIEYWLPLLSSLPRDSKVLAIGERNGGLSLWLALMGFNVVCTDVTDISERAGWLHKRYKVADRVSYRVFDVVNEEWEAGQYDVIIAKSVIGGLKAHRSDPSTRTQQVQRQAVLNIHRLLKPGGYFFSAENLRGNMLLHIARRLKGRNTSWRYLNYTEMESLFVAFTIVQTKTFGILPTFFSGKVQNWCICFLNKYVLAALPAGTKYIAFTVARK